jgi:hypothetical protein
VLLVALLPLFGCGDSGPRRYAIGGTVTAGGKPATQGRLTFVPTGPAPAAVAQVYDGEYRFDSSTGPVAGTYNIEFHQDPAAVVNATGKGPTATPRNLMPDIFVTSGIEISDDSPSKVDLALEPGKSFLED